MNYLDILKKDYFSPIQPLLKSGYYIDYESGLITRQKIRGWDVPWIYNTHEDPRLQCVKWHAIIFKHYNVIPRGCFNCYKVVVRPKTVVGLIKLLELQDNLPKEIKSIVLSSFRQKCMPSYPPITALSIVNAISAFL